MNKIGDRVFWVNFDNTIGSGIIIDISDDSYTDEKDNIIKYHKYEISNDDPDLGSGVIEDYNCLDKSDARVIEYLKTFKEKDIMIPLSDAVKWLENNLKDYMPESTFANHYCNEAIKDFKTAMRNAV